VPGDDVDIVAGFGGDVSLDVVARVPGWRRRGGVSVEAEAGSNLLPNLVMAPACPVSRMRA
jgi:hypothetical protein